MDQKQTEKAIAQTEVVLAALREPALKLLEEGVASSYSSTASRTARGLEVKTTDDKTRTQSVMLVDGKVESESRLVDTSGVHFDVLLKGDYSITHGAGQNARQEKSSFRLSGSMLDEWMGRPDKFNVSLTRTDAQGRPIQTYIPAISEAQRQLDTNGQPVRLARPAEGDANASLENIANPGNKRQEATYIIRDGNTDRELSYNETRERNPASWAYRSVVRDMKGNVLGIVHQTFSLNEQGDITSVNTSARKPMQLKK